jgi:hypothetical protein
MTLKRFDGVRLKRIFEAEALVRDLLKGDKWKLKQRLADQLSEKGGLSKLYFALWSLADFAAVLGDLQIEITIEEGSG